MVGDWIKLHRKSLDSAVFSDPWLWHLWCWCLLKANYKDGFFQTEPVNRGQFVTGRESGAKALRVSEPKWYRGMKKLEAIGNITLKSNNRFTIVTICNYDTYQLGDYADRTTSEQQANNGRTTSEQQANTIEERKELKKEKKVKKESPLTPQGEGQTDSEEIPSPAEFVERWNKLAAKHSKLKSVRVATGKRLEKIKTRLKEPGWYQTVRAASKQLPLGGDGWQPTLDWLVANDTNAYRLAEGEFAWRSSDDPALKRLHELRRKAEAAERETEIAARKKEHKRDAIASKRAIESILNPQVGSDEERYDSAWLFGTDEVSSVNGAAHASQPGSTSQSKESGKCSEGTTDLP